MSKYRNYEIDTHIKPMFGKYFCYLNGLLIGSFNTWHGANDYLALKVKEFIHNKDKEKEDNIKRNTMKQNEPYYPRNQDDEATKAILAYYKELKE